jgi:hypothetical protein
VTFRGVATAAAASATSITVSTPSSAVSGDLLLASVAVRGSATIGTPSGWTLIRSDANGSTMRLATYRRFAAAGDPASFTFTFSKSTTASVASVAAYAGVDTANPVDVAAGQVNATASKSAIVPSITTAVANDALLTVIGSASQVTATPPTGMTERLDLTSAGSSKIALEAADQTLAAAGASGTRTATLSKSTTSIGQSIALQPAS